MAQCIHYAKLVFPNGGYWSESWFWHLMPHEHGQEIESKLSKVQHSLTPCSLINCLFPELQNQQCFSRELWSKSLRTGELCVVMSLLIAYNMLQPPLSFLALFTHYQSLFMEALRCVRSSAIISRFPHMLLPLPLHPSPRFFSKMAVFWEGPISQLAFKIPFSNKLIYRLFQRFSNLHCAGT